MIETAFESLGFVGKFDSFKWASLSYVVRKISWSGKTMGKMLLCSLVRNYLNKMLNSWMTGNRSRYFFKKQNAKEKYSNYFNLKRICSEDLYICFAFGGLAYSSNSSRNVTAEKRHMVYWIHSSRLASIRLIFENPMGPKLKWWRMIYAKIYYIVEKQLFNFA